MDINSELQLALKYYQVGNIQHAENVVNKILEVQSNNISAINLLGIISYQLKNYDSTIELFKRVLALDPTNAFVYHRLIIALDKKGNKEEMMKYYQSAIELIPNFIDLVKKSAEGSRKGVWDPIYENYEGSHKAYCDELTMKKGAVFLSDPEIEVVEDWGCGYGGFKNFIAQHQTYIGIDGSNTPFADKIVDLEEYTSKVDAIFMRHVLEHNHNWERILRNAIASFEKKMVLILFTPFAEITHVIDQHRIVDTIVHDIAFSKEDITSHFSAMNWSSEENLQTNTQYKVEHIFYLTKYPNFH
jgi:tetratricopeptide (TPR) repeat protein